MNAPDKIYLHPDIGDREFIRSWGVRAVTTDAVCYINKDLLLELLKKRRDRVAEPPASPLDKGAIWTLDELIDKLNSL